MKKTTNLTQNALIAAIYAVLTLGFPVLSYGAIQFRVSEALCLLPALYPNSFIGLSVGCFISNILGAALGVNPLGFIDSVVGTSATLISSLLLVFLSKKIKKPFLKAVLFPLPTSLLNAVFIGAELTFISEVGAVGFLGFSGSIFLSEAVVCYTLGNLLLFLIKDKFIKR